MGNLLTSLYNSTNALSVYGRGLSAVQNNIANASSPGYARYDQSVTAQPFDPAGGLPGGVLAGPLISARSEFLEQQVRDQNELFSYSSQRAQDIGEIEPQFTLQDGSGVPGALSNFFDSFSQLSVNPNDPVARQTVIDRAGTVAQNFQQASINLSRVSHNVDAGTLDTVNKINRLTTQIAAINQHYRVGNGASQDAGLDAQLHDSLEQLAGLVNVSLVRTDSGAAQVYIAGQTPLVVEDKSFPIQADQSGSQTRILDATGKDVTQVVTGGQLGSLVDEKNRVIPGYLSDLSTLASTFADQVNGGLAAGLDSNGNPPTKGLFQYHNSSDAAFTLSVTNITPAEIAAASVTSPGGNGNAIAMSQLSTARVVNGFTFTQYFGQLGGRVGRDLLDAKQNQSQYQDLLNQTRQLRSAQTGVSLDAEAAKLLQYQQAYSAVGKLISILSDLTQVILSAVH